MDAYSQAASPPAFHDTHQQQRKSLLPSPSVSPLKPRGIGKDVLLSLLRRQSRHSGAALQAELQLPRLTHLPLDHSRLTQIPPLDAKETQLLSLCQSLQVLYLHDNAISRIEGLDFATSLTHLYLSHNRIQKLENISHMHRLEKLYISHNAIERVEGFSPGEDAADPSSGFSQLDGSTRPLPLSELHIASQQLPASSAGLSFSAASLQSISRTLLLLDISNNRITSATFSSLSCLCFLTTLLAANNLLSELPELTATVASLRSLSSLSLQSNPVTRQLRYREEVVRTASSALRELDGKEVRREEKDYLRDREKERERRKREQKAAVKAKADRQSGAVAVPAARAVEWKEQLEQVEAGVAELQLQAASSSRSGSREGRSDDGLGEVAILGIPAGRHSRDHSHSGIARDERLWTRGSAGSSASHSRSASKTG